MKQTLIMILFFLCSHLSISMGNTEGPVITSLVVEEWTYAVDYKSGVVELKSGGTKSIRFRPSGISNIPAGAPEGAVNTGAIRCDPKMTAKGDSPIEFSTNVPSAYDGSIVVLSRMPTGVIYRAEVSMSSGGKTNSQTIWIEKAK